MDNKYKLYLFIQIWFLENTPCPNPSPTGAPFVATTGISSAWSAIAECCQFFAKIYLFLALELIASISLVSIFLSLLMNEDPIKYYICFSIKKTTISEFKIRKYFWSALYETRHPANTGIFSAL